MVRQPSLNIGISEEYQIIDRETRELRSTISRVMGSERLILREQDAQGDVLVELPATLEMGTPVCANIKEARQALVQQSCARQQPGVRDLRPGSDRGSTRS